jgi:CheY-like chemotaxis protein
MLHRLVGSAIRLEIALPDGPAVVRADPTQLEQAIVNLVLNARDAMQDGGSVRVEVAVEEREAGASFSEEPGRWVHFGVSDTGVGMPPEVREHVFEPFFTTKDSGRGTGLGLTSALRAIEDAGGELHVESKPGEGTTFRARLPWCASPLAQDAGAGAGTGSAAAAGDILVVDDEPMVLRLVEATLVRAGHRVRAVADPQAALALVADPELAIDALISDVVLPGIAGPELARRVRALRPDVPVLFISGFVDSARLSPGDLDGGRVLRKPFSPRQLVDAAAELLAARRGGRNRGDTP